MKVGKGLLCLGVVFWGGRGRGGGGCRGRRMWEMRLLLWEVEWIESKEGGVVFGGCVLWEVGGGGAGVGWGWGGEGGGRSGVGVRVGVVVWCG